jgi:hypothetical protein
VIGYVVAVVFGGVLVGALGPLFVQRVVPEAQAPRWSWAAAGAAPVAALVAGLLTLPLFGRAGGWILGISASAAVVWRLAIPMLTDAISSRRSVRW